MLATTPNDEKKSIAEQKVAARSLGAILKRFGYFFIFRFPPSDSSMPRACIQNMILVTVMVTKFSPLASIENRRVIVKRGGKMY